MQAFPSVLSFFPHRVAYLLPLFLLKYENATTSFYPGLELQLFSSNSLSNLNIRFLQYFDTQQTNIHFQPIYNITYGYSIRPIGDILISSSRAIQYAPVSEALSYTISKYIFLWEIIMAAIYTIID